MKARPMLFGAPLVRSLLDGSKTQTRRVVLPRSKGVITGAAAEPFHAIEASGGGVRHIASRIACIPCPYGQTGDWLWVSETSWIAAGTTDVGGVIYCADHPNLIMGGMKKRPSIHMPRWASRILLEIVSVSVERLQDICEADAIAEGVTKVTGNFIKGLPGWQGHAGALPRPDAYTAFHDLWESITGAGSWDANPWVWVVKFKRVFNGALV